MRMLELAKLLRRSDVSSTLAIAVSAALVLPTPLAAAASTKAGSECTTTAATPEPSQPPRPSNAAPIRYPANDGDDPATFLTPAAVLAKFASSKKAPLRLKSCTLERWYQSAIARYGAIYVIDARRMVYEIVTTFDRYEGHGGAWVRERALSSWTPRRETALSQTRRASACVRIARTSVPGGLRSADGRLCTVPSVFIDDPINGVLSAAGQANSVDAAGRTRARDPGSTRRLVLRPI